MASKKYKLPLGEEMVNYIGRLSYEAASKKSLIDFMFDAHKLDKDTSLFESVPFQKYEKEYTEVFTELEIVKDKVTQILQELVDEKEGKKDTLFNWQIETYELAEATIEVLD